MQTSGTEQAQMREKEVLHYMAITGESEMLARSYLDTFDKYVEMYLQQELLDQFRDMFMKHVFLSFFYLDCRYRGIALLTEMLEFTKQVGNKQLTYDDLLQITMSVELLGHGLLNEDQRARTKESLEERPQTGE